MQFNVFLKIASFPLLYNFLGYCLNYRQNVYICLPTAHISLDVNPCHFRRIADNRKQKLLMLVRVT